MTPSSSNERSTGTTPAIEEEMTLAAGSADGLDDPSLLTPLDADRAAQTLAQAGFVTESGEPPTAQDLTVDQGELAHVTEAAQLMTLGYAGTLRALHIEPAIGDAAAWTEVVVALRRFADESGARFLSDDEFNADMDEDEDER